MGARSRTDSINQRPFPSTDLQECRGRTVPPQRGKQDVAVEVAAHLRLGFAAANAIAILGFNLIAGQAARRLCLSALRSRRSCWPRLVRQWAAGPDVRAAMRRVVK